MNQSIEATSLEVLFTPADFEALRDRDLKDATCVVFDVLRATSSMVTALNNGADGIIPVASIQEALDYHGRHPDALLAGERDGLRISAALTGGIEFHMGNSPREFERSRVAGKTIVMTTTNGTRALKACLNANRVLVSSILNLGATVSAILSAAPRGLLLVCSGTFEEAAYEDVLGAGALCDAVWNVYGSGKVADSARMAYWLYREASDDLTAALGQSRNGSRLLGRPELAGDVAFCAKRDSKNLAAELNKAGIVRKAG